MKTIAFLMGTLVLAIGAPLAAQVPPACTCNLTKNTSWGHPNIGHSQTTTASCSIVTVGASSFCEVSGTVSFVYAPVNLGAVFAQWGDPGTSFTPVIGDGSWTHPPQTRVQCGSGSVSSYLVVVSKIGGLGPDITLQVYKTWSCDTD